jgi:hypothetical protein
MAVAIRSWKDHSDENDIFYYLTFEAIYGMRQHHSCYMGKSLVDQIIVSESEWSAACAALSYLVTDKNCGDLKTLAMCEYYPLLFWFKMPVQIAQLNLELQAAIATRGQKLGRNLPHVKLLKKFAALVDECCQDDYYLEIELDYQTKEENKDEADSLPRRIARINQSGYARTCAVD